MYILAHANLNVNLQVIASGAQRSATVAGQSSIKSQTIGQSSISKDAWDITTLRILVYHIRKDGQSRSQILIAVIDSWNSANHFPVSSVYETWKHGNQRNS